MHSWVLICQKIKFKKKMINGHAFCHKTRSAVSIFSIKTGYTPSEQQSDIIFLFFRNIQFVWRGSRSIFHRWKNFLCQFSHFLDFFIFNEYILMSMLLFHPQQAWKMFVSLFFYVIIHTLWMAPNIHNISYT